jgi:hypothetical protein
MTSPGIEPAAYRFVAWCLNQLLFLYMQINFMNAILSNVRKVQVEKSSKNYRLASYSEDIKSSNSESANHRVPHGVTKQYHTAVLTSVLRFYNLGVFLPFETASVV